MKQLYKDSLVDINSQWRVFTVLQNKCILLFSRVYRVKETVIPKIPYLTPFDTVEYYEIDKASDAYLNKKYGSKLTGGSL